MQFEIPVFFVKNCSFEGYTLKLRFHGATYVNKWFCGDICLKELHHFSKLFKHCDAHSTAPEAAPAAPPCGAMSSMSEMAVSPTSVASSNHFPFTPTEISGMGMDASMLDAAFTSDVGNASSLQLGPDGGVGSSRDSGRSLGQLWNFSLSDLAVDMSNLGGNSDAQIFFFFLFLSFFWKW